MKPKKILIFNGSPKKNKSTSQVLAEFLAIKLLEKENNAGIIRISSCIASEQVLIKQIKQIKESDLIFFIFPLYVDSLPYQVIELFEQIKKHIGSDENNKKITFMALSHCGSDVTRNQTAVKVCECFSRELHFSFGGVFTLGSSSILNGTNLQALNRMTEKLQTGLEIIGESISTDKPIPQEVQNLMSKPFLNTPLFLSKILLNSTMKKCYSEKSFSKGISNLQSKLKLFFS